VPEVKLPVLIKVDRGLGVHQGAEQQEWEKLV
jgi:hypothetical protein